MIETWIRERVEFTEMKLNQKFIEKSWCELSEHQASLVSLRKEGIGQTAEMC